MMYLTLFVTVTTLIYAVFILRDEKVETVKKRLAFLDKDKQHVEVIEKSDDKSGSIIRRLFHPLWVRLKRAFRQKISVDKIEKLEQLLLQAGNPFSLTPIEFRLIQMIFMVLIPSISILYAFMLKVSVLGIMMFIMIGFAIAAYLPYFYLKQKIAERTRNAQRELPDILDLLTVSLEAGLGFDSALSKVVAKQEGVLSKEFHRCLEEIRLGKTRREALIGVRERVQTNDINILISSILQAEKLGVGLVQVFRVQSAEVRERRRQRAEEAAMKAPIKILFPLVLFIFPSIFIVLLGPAVIQFITTFSK
ncbi:pilus assembly protein TadC [Desulfuribacillus stibiiarsenatis]|uniref:Pilus assembly protein TadC n=1 Tax=Desulfuribacillus stibiiarsenatis TaxID=1390249 RepID=A0A1E5L7R2_9FIRM|nr:type II secretion system F family protein [Desulfuribacillus stibiiarsenatis]OEH86190.1 pilus assembly protein TadC [Desulfuribacillus stibiiarsenatis]